MGIRYAEAGQDEAVALGEQLTSPAMPRRAEGWRSACDARPSAFLCWRGGMRSELAQRLAGRPEVPCVEGGYKAVRAHLMESLPASLARRRIAVVTGPTGAGKTELLRELAALPGVLALDLEEAAEHRGSSFGGRGPQPPQQTFEHRLALPLLLGDEPWLVLEDESRNVGQRHLPEPIYRVVREAPLLVLEDDLESRLRRIHREYAVEPARAHGQDAARATLETALLRLKRRLGGAIVHGMVERLRAASGSGAWHDPEAFRGVIVPLLTDYYDPLYRKATPTEGRAVLARGSREELSEWLRHTTAPSRA